MVLDRQAITCMVVSHTVYLTWSKMKAFGLVLGPLGTTTCRAQIAQWWVALIIILSFSHLFTLPIVSGVVVVVVAEEGGGCLRLGWGSASVLSSCRLLYCMLNRYYALSNMWCILQIWTFSCAQSCCPTARFFPHTKRVAERCDSVICWSRGNQRLGRKRHESSAWVASRGPKP
jgi:hypothetical protein